MRVCVRWKQSAYRSFHAILAALRDENVMLENYGEWLLAEIEEQFVETQGKPPGAVVWDDLEPPVFVSEVVTAKLWLVAVVRKTSTWRDSLRGASAGEVIVLHALPRNPARAELGLPPL